MILYEDFCDGEDLAVKKKGFLMLLVSIHIYILLIIPVMA